MRSFGTWLKSKGHWQDSGAHRVQWSVFDKQHFRTRIQPQLVKLCRRWDIFDLFPPEYGQEEMLKDGAGDWRSFPPTGPPPVGYRDYRCRTRNRLGDSEFLGAGSSAKQYKNLLIIQIDLNLPSKDLLKYVRHALIMAKHRFKGEMRADGLPPKGRRRFDDYDVHLRVWDLNLNGKSVREIASIVFPDDYGNSAVQKVRDHLDSATRLISGHYKDIS